MGIGRGEDGRLHIPTELANEWKVNTYDIIENGNFIER
jgi:hypothetical protein